MAYLSDFIKDARKKGKIKSNQEVFQEAASRVDTQIQTNGGANYYAGFAGSIRPDAKPQIDKAFQESSDQRKKLVETGMQQGMSWENIAMQSGLTTEEVKSYSEQINPNYGIVAPKRGRNPLSVAIDTINPLDSGRSLTTADPSAEGANRSAFQQSKEFGSSLFTGLEKVGDSLEALPNYSITTPFVGTKSVVEKRLQHWDEQLKKGNISKDEYQKLLEKQLKDTEWAGTGFDEQGNKDSGFDNLKKAAGVSLEATSEIVPFLKAGKAAQLTTKGGAAFGGVTGLAHGTGQELTNPEGFNWANVGLQTAVGTGAGAIFGRMAQNTAEAKQFLRNYNTQRVLNTLDNTPDAIQPITDTTRLLSATTTSTRQGVISKLDEVNTKLNDIQSGKRQADVVTEPSGLGNRAEPAGNAQINKDGSISKKSNKVGVFADETQVTRTDTTSIKDEFKALVKEREELTQQLDAIESGSGPLERVAQINDELGKGTLDPDQTANLLSERQTILASVKENPSPVAQTNAAFIEEQTSTALKNQALVDPTLPSPQGNTGTPKTAQRAAEMTGGTTDAAYSKLTREAEENTYRSLKQNNPEVIEGIVKGDVDARQYGLTNSYVLTSEANAARKGSGAMAKELANSKGWSRISQSAQEVSSASNLDANNPIKIMRKVIEARKAAKANGANIVADISDTEADQILVRTNRLERLNEKVMAEIANGNLSIKSRLEYGQAKVDLDKYAEALKPSKTPRQWVSSPWSAFMDVAGTSKSLRATLDVSGILRQGAKLLASGHYRIWARNTLKSLKVAAKSFGDENVMDAVNADIVSRPNYLNGLYKKMGIPLYDIIEEAFPSKALGKVPFLSKLYGASDSAYTSFMQLNRADLADMYIDKALKANVDLATEGKAIGSFVNSLSSRASLGRAEGGLANAMNNVFFSPRLLKSNFDVLGGHVVSGGGGLTPIKGGSNFVRKHAAMNLVKIAATTYGILKLADEVRPNSVEWDPRSSNYGKVKIGNTRFDVTGGMSSLVTLGARLATGSSKSSLTDITSEFNDPENKFSPTYLSVLGSFGENKLSPIASALQDIVAQEDFTGKKPTVGSTLRNLTFPIAIDNYKELSEDPHAAPIVASMLLEGLGISTNTYDSTDDWQVKTTNPQKAFKQAVGDAKFKSANEEYNKEYTDWFRGIRYGEDYKKLSDKDRRKLVGDAGDDLEKNIMAKYGFTYKRPDTVKSDNDSLINELNKFK